MPVAANEFSELRQERTVLFIDIVESSRLLEQDERQTIGRWRALVGKIENSILPSTGGRIVNSLGDGLLLDFSEVSTAVSTALRIQAENQDSNKKIDPSSQMLLRMGIQVSDVLVDKHDIYGHGVMMGARLMTLAGPGEVVVSAAVRDQLAAGLDADIEDLGECFLKHVKEPVRAFRVGPPGPMLDLGQSIIAEQVLPTVAVVPLTGTMVSQDLKAIGEVIAEELIRALSVSSNLNVISRLSMSAFKDRSWTLKDLRTQLNANYVLSGRFHVDGSALSVGIELADTQSGHVVWTDQFRDTVSSVLDASSDLLSGMAEAINAWLLTELLYQTESQPWRNLESYKLMLGAVARMHSNSQTNFQDAFKMLERVASLATRQSSPHAWMGKWYVLKAQQGWSDDPIADGEKALISTQRALNINPRDSLALTTDGFVHTNLLRRLDVAEERYDQAVAANPNDSLAWLAKGTLHAFKGEGTDAVKGTQRALMLSPFDPIRYFYDSLAATAKLASEEYEDALTLAEHSLRANSSHTSTMRVKAAAQWKLGQRKDAVRTAEQLIRMEPNLKVSDWLARSPARDYSIGREWANVLREVGIPD